MAKGAQALQDRNRAAGGSGSLMDTLQGLRAEGADAMPDLGALLGGGGSNGGLGDILEGLGGSSGGLSGLSDLLAGGAGAGALGGLGGLLGGSQGTQPAFGARLNEALSSGGEPSTEPTADEEAMAGLMIRAMIMAAKSDGRIDAAERENILGALSDASAEERAFIEAELHAPIDVAGFAAEVPRDAGLRRQVFATAMLAIDLDSQAEARFMSDLARALGVNQDDLDAITGRMGGQLRLG